MTPSQKATIRWRSRRGMLELDLVLKRLSDNFLDNLTDDETLSLLALLDTEDPVLYFWLIENGTPPNPAWNILVKRITDLP